MAKSSSPQKLVAPLITLLLACGSSKDEVVAASANAWTLDVPYDLENFNSLSFIDQDGALVEGFIGLEPTGMSGVETFLYRPWVFAVIPTIKVFTPNGSVTVSIDLGDFSPFLWDGQGVIPASSWYYIPPREIFVSGEAPALLDDGVSLWPVLIKVNFRLYGDNPTTFLWDPESQFQNSVTVTGDPLFGLSANDILGVVDFYSVVLKLDG